MMRIARAVAAGALAAGFCFHVQAAPSAACPPPVEAEPASGPLTHLAASLKSGGTLDILAVGTGSAREPAMPPAVPPGSPATVRPNGFGSQIAHALEAAVPGLRVNVTLQGGGGLEAGPQVDIIRAALKRHHYQLVLWQTGTVEAVNDDPSDEFYQALSDGADAAAAGGADLILVEPQYSRFLEANANVSPYLSVMQAVSALPGTVLFHRYELMHDWVDAGLIDLESAAAVDRPAVAARLRACLGAELARMLLADVAATAD